VCFVTRLVHFQREGSGSNNGESGKKNPPKVVGGKKERAMAYESEKKRFAEEHNWTEKENHLGGWTRENGN